MDGAVTRGHNYRVHGGRYRKDVRGRFCTQYSSSEDAKLEEGELQQCLSGTEGVDWGKMFEGKSTSGMWEALKCKLIGIEDRHIPVRMKDKYSTFRELCVMRDILSPVKGKKEAFVTVRRLGTHEASVEYKESRKKLKQGVRWD